MASQATQGAISGATQGAMTGNPYAALAGAALGGLSGMFGGSADKSQIKAIREAERVRMRAYDESKGRWSPYTEGGVDAHQYFRDMATPQGIGNQYDQIFASPAFMDMLNYRQEDAQIAARNGGLSPRTGYSTQIPGRERYGQASEWLNMIGQNQGTVLDTALMGERQLSDIISGQGDLAAGSILGQENVRQGGFNDSQQMVSSAWDSILNGLNRKNQKPLYTGNVGSNTNFSSSFGGGSNFMNPGQQMYFDNGQRNLVGESIKRGF